jgi:hypothetical protein
MFSSAGAPATTEQTNKTFTAREIEAMIVDPATSQIITGNINEKRHPLDDFFGQFTRAAADQKELREKVKNDKRFIFNPEHSFERGELVIIPRGDNTYRFALIMGYAGKDNDKDDIYRVQIDKKGAYKKIKTALIGKINRKIDNDHTSVGPKVAASTPVLADQNVKHVQEKKPALFSEKELDYMMVYYPYPLIGEFFFFEDDNYSSEFNNFFYKCILKDYIFSRQNIFNRGERVMVCGRGSSNKKQGVVLGHDPDKEIYYVEVGFKFQNSYLRGAMNLLEEWPSENLGKYKKYIQQSSTLPLDTKTPKLFTEEELIVLPVGYQAKNVIGKCINFHFLLPKNKSVSQYFKFDQNNSFNRAELVLVQLPGEIHCYGLVLGYIESSKKYAVQVSKKESFDYSASEIGKLKLDFNLLGISSKEVKEQNRIMQIIENRPNRNRPKPIIKTKNKKQKTNIEPLSTITE